MMKQAVVRPATGLLKEAKPNSACCQQKVYARFEVAIKVIEKKYQTDNICQMIMW